MSSRESAVRLADDLLFPAALQVDRADRVPASHFEALAREGFYDFDGDLQVVETLASGCLATTFVWLQHLGALASAAKGHPELHAALAQGRLKGGTARAGARPGTRSLKVSSTVDGFVLDGQIPWVTGWGMIDIIEVAALDKDDNVVFLLIDLVDPAEAAEFGTLTAKLNQLMAVNASRTATLTFTGHHVPADRFVRTQPSPEWQAAEASGSRLNAALALGVASRCTRLLKSGTAKSGTANSGTAKSGTANSGTALATQLDLCRQALVDADDAALPRARAAASALAMHAAGILTVQTGSRAVLLDNHAQRLVREAAFLLVFGTRPKIKEELLKTLTVP